MKKIKIALMIAGTAICALIAAAILCFCIGDLSVTLNGESHVVLEYKQPYMEQGAHASYKLGHFQWGPTDERLLPDMALSEGELGSYTLTYSYYVLWRKAVAVRTVDIVDTKPPQITLVTGDGYTIPGQNYVEEGYSAWDEHDGDLTDKVTVEMVDGNAVYTVVDSSGNVAQQVRNIRYHDPVAPQLSLRGDPEITIFAGDAFVEPGYFATDNVDGDLTAAVAVAGDLNTYIAGRYFLTYTVTDAYGNSASKTRNITVQRRQLPAIVTPDEKVIYLTFDDGPSKYTPKLLEILKRYGVKATFFVANGYYLDTLPQIAADGHTIGIHTYTHRYNEIYADMDAYFLDLRRIEAMIYEKTGLKPSILRFPGGSLNSIAEQQCPGIMDKLCQAVTDMGYRYFDWNVSSGDSGGTLTTEQIVNNVISGLQGKQRAVVLQHDIIQNSVDAVEQIIQWGLENGYTFLPLTAQSPACQYAR